MQSDCGKAEYKLFPKLFKQVVKSASAWWETHPNAASHKKFPNIYGLVVHNLFFDSYGEFATTFGGFWTVDYKAFLEDYFKIDLTDNVRTSDAEQADKGHS